ncbi:unnamed protein product [Clonostachys rhizophaga]|uniref:Amidase domain-containing protein n=1 Tax=Clonostachys rhizophaga TaxID=160324 RepID=A0A9N9V4S0_9HYPO|nr:unnamed protein product [Clonostachys rhizophaga]
MTVPSVVPLAHLNGKVEKHANGTTNGNGSHEPLHVLTGSEALRRIREGSLTVEAYARALLNRIQAHDAAVKAWAYLDPAFVLEQARALDRVPAKERGPLHGLPIGVKDAIYTKDMPTEHNSEIYKGSFPQVDSASIMILRDAGALIFGRVVLKGKTVTTEFAAITIGPKTMNPHSPHEIRSPGGSSSGSAAGVADGQIPVALATQTGGSTIRPASYNGIYCIKPTWNAVSREGQKLYSLLLDTLGWYGRSVSDLVLLADIFSLEDDEPSTFNGIRGAKFALCKTNNWHKASEATRQALARAAALLKAHGAIVEDLDLPPSFEPLTDWYLTVLETDGATTFLPEHRVARSKLHESLAVFIDKPAYTRKQTLAAQDGIAALRPEFDAIASQYDAVLTPSAVDEAPYGLEYTGDAVFCADWTALHVPVVNIPGFQGPSGMPVGVSLVAPRFRDRHLLRVAEDVGKIFESEGGWKSNIL